MRNADRKIETYEEAIKLHGIAQKTAVKLVEIVQSGKCTQLESKSPKDRVLDVFTKIYGKLRSLEE